MQKMDDFTGRQLARVSNITTPPTIDPRPSGPKNFRARRTRNPTRICLRFQFELESK
jgi:hypothetical protein